MNKLLIPLAFATALPLSSVAAPVTWDFVVTSCNTSFAQGSGCDPTAKYPVSLVSLGLNGPDSSGSATLNGFFGTAVLTGDPFLFVVSPNPRQFASTAQPLGMGWANGTPPPPADAGLVDYDIEWQETAGVLTSVGISFLTEFDQIKGLGLTGGMAGSDNQLVGCFSALCDVSGFWVDAPPVVPTTAPGMIMVYLLAAIGSMSARRVRCGVA